MVFCTFSQSLIFTGLLFTLLFTAVTTAPVAWAWLTIAIMLGTLLMIDYMFADEKAFTYDPDYKTWKQKTQIDS